LVNDRGRKGGRERGRGTYSSCAEFLDDIDGAVGAENMEELDDMHVVEGLLRGREGGRSGSGMYIRRPF